MGSGGWGAMGSGDWGPRGCDGWEFQDKSMPGVTGNYPPPPPPKKPQESQHIAVQECNKEGFFWGLIFLK